jgi:hypothetical protein
MKKWFDDYGNLIKDIPQEIISECSHQGDCYFDCKKWIKEIDFNVPRQLSIDWLREFGAWTIEELNSLDDMEIAIQVLWIACSDLKENGEWFGLNH